MRSALIALLFFAAVFVSIVPAQERPPSPSAPKRVKVPAVDEVQLKNRLTVAVAERKNVPLVTILLLMKAGAKDEPDEKAGLADVTATMLTKGTKTRTATQIAEAVEFLGGSINSGAGWNSSSVSITVTSDKVAQALAIIADVVLNPKFDQQELDLLKSQTLDELNGNLKQPGFIASYVASKYSFGEHPAGGTPASIQSISRADVVRFHSQNYVPDKSVLIFSGNINSARASQLSEQALARWQAPMRSPAPTEIGGAHSDLPREAGAGRILVIDLPKSGQAAVTYAKSGLAGRRSQQYYPSIVTNSVLGGGYSARLNYEIRIKRGLSYGAGSSLAWRALGSNFSTRAQTKNQSAGEVAELTLGELQKLSKDNVERDELVPRKSVLTGGFGRNLETTAGLASALAELYSFGIPASELNNYVSNVNSIKDAEIRSLAGHLLGGDLIIVGDYSVFKDDLAKRFPKSSVAIIKAADLDLSKAGLHH